MIDLRLGDCLETLKALPDNSIDALVTDPPAGISFMNLAFDHHKGGRDQWVAWLSEILIECKRVMKPGAIGFVWSLPRTQHWSALACEDAGFVIWDNVGVAHVQGGGFPKGQAIDLLVDKRLGKSGDREVLGENPHARPNSDGVYNRTMSGIKGHSSNITAPVTPEAQQWDGWRTKALKPALEFWIAIQKPLEGSCVDNVLNWGVGGVNIDACRVSVGRGSGSSSGRYPANFILQHSPSCTETGCAPECPCEILGGQSGVSFSGGGINKHGLANSIRYGIYRGSDEGDNAGGLGDTGTAARYFHQFDPPFKYQSKASPRDRNEGVDQLLWRRDKSSSVGWSPCTADEYEALDEIDRARGNIHATTKSTQLMEFFVKLATPPGGIVLDPFMGSGTTGVACVKNGFSFIGIEREPHYMTIAQTRINHTQPNTLEQRIDWLETQVKAIDKHTRPTKRKPLDQQINLFNP